MNRVLGSVTKMDRETPIQLLLQTSGFLSFHQMCAHSILKTAHKVLITEKPVYLYQKLVASTEAILRLSRQEPAARTKYKSSISREGFIYQASKLLSKIPPDLRSTQNIEDFKKKSRLWVKENITIYM